MDKDKFIRRAMGHVLYPGSWTRYWLLTFFYKMKFGPPDWRRPDEILERPSGKVVANYQTHILYLPWSLRCRLLLSGAACFRTTVIIDPQNYGSLASGAMFSVLPPKFLAPPEGWSPTKFDIEKPVPVYGRKS